MTNTFLSAFLITYYYRHYTYVYIKPSYSQLIVNHVLHYMRFFRVV